MNLGVWTSIGLWVWLGGSAGPSGRLRGDPTQVTGTLTVRVVAKEAHHVPIRGAILRLIGETRTITGISDEDGHTFVALAPGSYRLQVLKPAYIPTECGAAESGGRGTQSASRAEGV